jgi:hypothetical protein
MLVTRRKEENEIELRHGKSLNISWRSSVRTQTCEHISLALSLTVCILTFTLVACSSLYLLNTSGCALPFVGGLTTFGASSI